MADHEKRRTIEVEPASSARRAERGRVCDANNNSGKLSMLTSALGPYNKLTTMPMTADSRLVEKDDGNLSAPPARSQAQKLGQETGELRSARRSESTVSESDDWHLLDADEQSISSSVSSLVSASREKLSTATSDSVTTERARTKMAQSKRANISSDSNAKYHDIELLNGDKLSPALVYICTVIYSLLPLASLIAFVTLICLLFTKLWFVTVIYYSYLIFDGKTCNQGGRRWPSVYRAKFWSYLAAYFPIKLRYTSNFKLDQSENYILNYHPHGISAFGCVSAFATNGLNFSELFPGIKSCFMVHETSFLVPIMRETFAYRGDCSVNSKSFDYILGKRWQAGAADGAGSAPSLSSKQIADARGHLLALCGGGLAEADLSDMETLKIVCATRKGFVKKSLIHGAHLIPCIAFGENSVFTKVNFKPGSLLYRLEKIWYKLFKFKHPIYFGRSIMLGNSGRGSVPYKRPITVVMGDPIHVERVEEPTQDQIDELHSRYIERLKSMYEDNKAELCTKYDTKLKLV